MPSSGHGRKDQANPLKDQGMSKEKVKEKTDHAPDRGARVGADKTATGQGGARGSTRRADADHPGQKGGVHADDVRGPAQDRRKEKGVKE